MDDYKAIYSWANAYLPNHSFVQSIKAIFIPYNECRIVFSRSLYYLDYLVFGSIDLRHLLLVSQVGLVLIFGLLIYHLKSIESKSLLVVLVALIFFQFEYYDSIFWTNAALQNVWSIAFGILTFSFIQKNSIIHFTLSLIFGTLALLTYGNGMLVLLILMAYLIFKRRYFHAALSVLIYSLAVYLYFKDFMINEATAFTFQRIFNTILFSVLFLGGSVQFLYQMYLPTLLGMLLYFFFFKMIITRYHHKNPMVFMVLSYVILSGMMAGWVRGTTSLSIALSMRYGIFSAVGMICCLIYFYENQEAKYFKTKLLIPFCLLIHFASNFFFFPEVIVRKEKLETFISTIKENKTVTPQPPAITPDAESITKEAIEKGIYKPY